jgi:uncharacterized protein
MLKKLRGLGYFLAALAVILLGLTWWMAGVLTQPRASSVDMPTKLGAETISLKSADGLLIKGSFLPPRKLQSRCILFLHGNGGNRSQFRSQLSFLKAHGHGALAIDFRAHGESGGKLATAGGFEFQDADVAFDALKQRCGDRKIFVYGLSLGGAAALQGKAATKADGVILDAVYQDIEKAISVRLDHMLGLTGGKIFTPLLMQMLEWRTGIDRQKMDNVKAAQKVTAPMLLLIGGDDWQAPESQMMAIAKASHSKSVRTVVVPNAVHGANAHMLGKDYAPLILSFGADADAAQH